MRFCPKSGPRRRASRPTIGSKLGFWVLCDLNIDRGRHHGQGAARRPPSAARAIYPCAYLKHLSTLIAEPRHEIGHPQYQGSGIKTARFAPAPCHIAEIFWPLPGFRHFKGPRTGAVVARPSPCMSEIVKTKRGSSAARWGKGASTVHPLQLTCTHCSGEQE